MLRHSPSILRVPRCARCYTGGPGLMSWFICRSHAGFQNMAPCRNGLHLDQVSMAFPPSKYKKIDQPADLAVPRLLLWWSLRHNVRLDACAAGARLHGRGGDWGGNDADAPSFLRESCRPHSGAARAAAFRCPSICLPACSVYTIMMTAPAATLYLAVSQPPQ